MVSESSRTGHVKPRYVFVYVHTGLPVSVAWYSCHNNLLLITCAIPLKCIYAFDRFILKPVIKNI